MSGPVLALSCPEQNSSVCNESMHIKVRAGLQILDGTAQLRCSQKGVHCCECRVGTLLRPHPQGLAWTGWSLPSCLPTPG